MLYVFGTCVRVWNVESGSMLNILRDHTQAVQDLHFNDNNTMVTASRVSEIGHEVS